MAYQEIRDQIEVIVFFERGRLHPLRFRWNGRAYRIRRVNNSWSVQEGTSRRFHFSVTTNSTDCYELVLDVPDFKWELERVYLEG